MDGYVGWGGEGGEMGFTGRISHLQSLQRHRYSPRCLHQGAQNPPSQLGSAPAGLSLQPGLFREIGSLAGRRFVVQRGAGPRVRSRFLHWLCVVVGG